MKRIRKLFEKEVKKVQKNESRREVAMTDKNVNMMKGEAVRIRWAEYFDGPLNIVNDRESRISIVVGEKVQVMTEENVSIIIVE